jgi:hypothetical protein
MYPHPKEVSMTERKPPTVKQVAAMIETMRRLAYCAPQDIEVMGGNPIWDALIEAQRCATAKARYLYGDEACRQAGFF